MLKATLRSEACRGGLRALLGPLLPPKRFKQTHQHDDPDRVVNEDEDAQEQEA